ncbi:LacI family DNA-binding transcriptional regulator [Microbacteriaceae bacterium VKM Ac-2855]|nr:LacI family DNA-binding transcriptional regulator [Microbacteriaceae bacterium VKM Ac-2855]
MAGIEDVARLAGLSTATVSRALSGNGHVSPASRERVRAAAAELGYVVSSNASSLASGRMKNVGVIIPRLGPWFFSSVLEGAEQTLLAHGYDLTLYNLTGGGEARTSVFEEFLPRNRVDAVLAISLELTAAELQSLHALNKPIVGVGGPLPGVRTLSIDDEAVARLATEHLISLGHRRIGMIGGDAASDRDFHIPLRRADGYRAALIEAGLVVDPSLFEAAAFSTPGGYEAAKQLLGSPSRRPTAIVASSDEMAFGALMAARDLGFSVPRDVSIIGIDGHELGDFFGLSTVAQHPRRQGERAVGMLLGELRPDLDDVADLPVAVDLVVRSSTSRPPAQ